MSLLVADYFEDTTFDSMQRQVKSVAYRLGREGVDRGDRVAVIGESHPNWAIAYLAILHIGAVATPIDPATTVRTLASFLMDSETSLVFVSDTCLDKVCEACASLDRKIQIVFLQPSFANDKFDCLTDWAHGESPELLSAPAHVSPADLALLMYTSGTSGRPKGVPLNHGNIASQIDAVEKIMGITDVEVVLSILPLFHAYPQIINLWLAATIGARVVYLSQLGISEIEDGLRLSRATALIGVPRLWYLIHQKIFDTVNKKSAPTRWLFRTMLKVNGLTRDYARINLGLFLFRPIHLAVGGRLRLAVSGGATFDKRIARDLHLLGFTILQGYGLTETSGAITATRFDDNRIGSVGKPIGITQVRIDDPDTRGIGEILIRGPSIMPGYYRNQADSAKALSQDGWFRSGDLGYFDQEGNLFIVGRKKDVIILPSGKNVFPEDIENHYGESPLINEICVLGRRQVNGYEGDECLCAIVVPNFDFLRAQRITNPAEWIRWELEDLGRELPEYQRVHDFVFRTEPLPRTTTRKVKRFQLQQELESALADHSRHSRTFVFSANERDLMNSRGGRTISEALRLQKVDVEEIHPLHNLEIDLKLDSLARIECISRLEQSLAIRLDPEETSSAFTVGDIVILANQKIRANGKTELNANQENEPRRDLPSQDFNWQQILDVSSTDQLKIPLLHPGRIQTFMASLLLGLIYLAALVLFRMKVEGRSILREIKPPYLLCPNHQSYIDAFIVGSTLPLDVLRQTVHLGASRYFTGVLTSKLAKLIKVVPIDPDVHLLGAMRSGAEMLRQGRVLNIYPEGRRSFDGELGVFKKGAAILATELNVPIVPVALDGTYRIWPRRSSRLKPAKVTISFGEPIHVSEVALPNMSKEQTYEAVTALVKESIVRMLKRRSDS